MDYRSYLWIFMLTWFWTLPLEKTSPFPHKTSSFCLSACCPQMNSEHSSWRCLEWGQEYIKLFEDDHSKCSQDSYSQMIFSEGQLSWKCTWTKQIFDICYIFVSAKIHLSVPRYPREKNHLVFPLNLNIHPNSSEILRPSPQYKQINWWTVCIFIFCTSLKCQLRIFKHWDTDKRIRCRKGRSKASVSYIYYSHLPHSFARCELPAFLQRGTRASKVIQNYWEQLAHVQVSTSLFKAAELLSICYSPERAM